MLRKFKKILSIEDLFLLLPVLLFFVLLLLLTPGYFHGDVSYWIRWAQYADDHGVSKIYQSGANYPPVYLYILTAYASFFDNFQDSLKEISRLKWITLIFDFLPVFIMFFAGMRESMRKNLHWFLLFNYAYLCNTLIWGQVDAIHTSLCLLSLVLAIRYPVAAMAVFVVALNSKVQSIIFLPLLGILYWPHLQKPRTIIKIVAVAIVTELIIVFPFIVAGEIDRYFQVYMGSVTTFPVVSMNAYNFWYLLLPGNLRKVPDLTQFLLFSYREWGLLLFFISSALILSPLFLRVRKFKMSYLTDDKGQSLLFLCAGLLTVSFFFFNTQMHERYSHPAIIFFFFYALKSRNYMPYIAISAAYLLSLEKLLEFFNISHASFIFEPKVIAALYAAGILLAFRNLVWDYPYSEIKRPSNDPA